MSCVKIAIMPHPPNVLQTLSLQSMSYRHPRAWNTIVVNTPTPTPVTYSPAPGLSVSPSSRYSSSSPSTSTRRPPSKGNASEIIPRLYISDLSFVENPSALSAYRITHVLSVIPETVAIPPPHILPIQPARLQIKVEDFPFAELAAHLPTTTKFIRDALSRDPESRVVVHCAEGISRSVSVVAAFLMAVYGWAPTEAIRFIKDRRGVANPNFGFIQQLHEYGRDVLGQRLDMPRSPS